METLFLIARTLSHTYSTSIHIIFTWSWWIDLFSEGRSEPCDWMRRGKAARRIPWNGWGSSQAMHHPLCEQIPFLIGRTLSHTYIMLIHIICTRRWCIIISGEGRSEPCDWMRRGKAARRIPWNGWGSSLWWGSSQAMHHPLCEQTLFLIVRTLS